MGDLDTPILTASTVLLLMPDQADAPVAVLLERQVIPSSVLLDVLDRRATFVRLRRGPNVHGLTEPYRQLTRAEAADCEPGETVTFDRYAQARFARSASLFGAPDTIAFVPLLDARPPARVRVPIPSLDLNSWHDFVLSSANRTECTYRIAGAAEPVGTPTRGVPDALSTR
ncbi:hypothetical protein ACFVWR_00895 [Leifsonia sp. NPDC058292]|uniref:hypothetical protein n=1 Tax=Leifsonia sp. NPDC058292 TaxID=3346428 RepID=UPI0036DF3D96